MCPELPPFGQSPQGRPPRWNDRRVLVFTENREGTKRYLRNILDQAIAGTDRADERIEVIDGLTQGARRKEIQRRFNANPAVDPLRILLATDAAPRGPELPGPLRRPLPLRPAVEPRPHRAAQRPHRPQAASRRRRCAATTSCCRSGSRTGVLEVLVRKTEDDQARAGQPVEGHRRRRRASAAGAASATGTPTG